MIEPSECHVLLRALCERAGLSQRKFADALDYAAASSVERYFTTERKKYLPLDFVIRAAAALEGKGDPPIRREEVLPLAGPLPDNVVPLPSPVSGSGGSVVDGKLSIFGAKDLPILGHDTRADGGYAFESVAEARAYTVRPVELVNVQDAYAFRVQDDFMEPAFVLGGMAYVDPTQPALPGDDVIVILKDGTGYLRVLVRRTPKQIVCRQHKPAQEQTFPAGQVRDIHVVVLASRRRV